LSVYSIHAFTLKRPLVRVKNCPDRLGVSSQ
jgi:hypothetical protein